MRKSWNLIRIEKSTEFNKDKKIKIKKENKQESEKN